MEYKVIPNFEKYSISSQGEVINNKTKKVIKPKVGAYLSYGLYQAVQLCL